MRLKSGIKTFGAGLKQVPNIKQNYRWNRFVDLGKKGEKYTRANVYCSGNRYYSEIELEIEDWNTDDLQAHDFFGDEILFDLEFVSDFIWTGNNRIVLTVKTQK